MADTSWFARAGADTSELLIVKAGTLIDGTGAPPRRGVQLVIRAGRIVDIVEGGAAPSDAQVVDYPGRRSCPA